MGRKRGKSSQGGTALLIVFGVGAAAVAAIYRFVVENAAAIVAFAAVCGGTLVLGYLFSRLRSRKTGSLGNAGVPPPGSPTRDFSRPSSAPPLSARPRTSSARWVDASERVKFGAIEISGGKPSAEVAEPPAMRTVEPVGCQNVSTPSLKQLSSTSMACTALAKECAGRPLIGAMALGAIGCLTPRLFDDNLRRVGSGGAPGRAAEYSGGSDPRVSRVGCEITWKRPVGGEIAIVVAAVVIPAAGVAIA
jgi:hypothetical protein